MPCLIILGLVTLAMLTSNDVFELINYTSFVESLFMTVSVAGLLWLRYKQPNRERPIKVLQDLEISAEAPENGPPPFR